MSLFKIIFSIPTKVEIIKRGFEVKVAREGERWEKKQLGDYADKKGVYILHSNGKILYIGVTMVRKWGVFGERLRREFKAKAEKDSNIYNLLVKQEKPIFVYLLDIQEIDKMVNSEPIMLPSEQKALIMERVLINVYKPEGNKQ